MTERAERATRVAEAADAWLQDPMRASAYKALASAVRDWRRLQPETPPPPPVAAELEIPDGSREPKMHRNPDFLRDKQSRLFEDHVAPVQALVQQIRAARNTDTVPYVDPVSGGIHARVLFLLESPAGPAALGSGMLSPDNDDETAANMWRLYQQSGLRRSAGLHWNAVPWYVGTDKRNGTVSTSDVEDGVQWLGRLLELLPDLQLVITMGKPAERSFQVYRDQAGARDLHWLAVAHPSPRVKNGHPGLWPAVEEAFVQAAQAAT